jgi:hypothetical protein
VSGKPGTKLDSAGNLRVLKCGMKQFYRNPRWKTLRITPMRLQYLSSRLLHLTTLFQEALSQILMESVLSLIQFGRNKLTTRMLHSTIHCSENPFHSHLMTSYMPTSAIRLKPLFSS